MKYIGAINVFVGVMAGFSAVMALIMGTFTATSEPTRYITYSVVLALAGMCGVFGGWQSFRSQRSNWLTPLFAVLMLIFCGLLWHAEEFRPVRHGVLALYSAVVLGIAANEMIRRPAATRPAVTESPADQSGETPPSNSA